MSIGNRKLVVVSVIAAVLALANAGAIVTWLHGIGLIPFAECLRAEYITGGTIAVILALLILLPSRAEWVVPVRRCPVCDGVLLRRGKYCAECGSRA